jgi:hypothetical protein
VSPQTVQSAGLTPPAFAIDDSPNHTHRGRHPPSPPRSRSRQSFSNLTAAHDESAGINDSSSPPHRSRTLRKPSPGLLARLKLLDLSNKSRVVSSPALCQDKIGKIPESQLRELDSLHRASSIRVERRGTAWAAGSHPALTPQRTGDSAPDMDFAPPPPELDSDQSSIISTSDRVLLSDSDQSDNARDNQKFRLPDLEKTKPRSSLMNEIPSDDSAESTRAPTPPPKDVSGGTEASWRPNAETSSDLENYLRNRGVSRANSIYSLSRASFTNQIQQLTSIRLPDATSLSSSISAIPTSNAAARALVDAALQIKQWMQKASEVLNGLDAEDDVEWAAAAGRDGLDEVDVAITRFESLVTVYVAAIEGLQEREDIASLSAQDLKRVVEQMEDVVGKWSQIKQTLKNVKEQVEIAMEWEELWNSVLGEIGMELDGLARLIFEMEERRHRAAQAGEAGGEHGENIEIGELETIVEEAPKQNVRAAASNRFSFTPAFGTNSPLLSPTSEAKQEDSNLLKLFARMQPLRASLDFLPMRLAGFNMRASPTFPSACGELDTRKEQLEKQWHKLEGDAEGLRRELGEDRWVHLFRNAAGKALSMWQSHIRTIRKLRKALDESMDQDHITMRLRTYEEKKPHYPPAIERVLTIIEKGVKDRLTVNGEILRLQADIKQKLADLHAEIKATDAYLEESYYGKSQQLRDSISSILSTEKSFASSAFDTPGSSPASSVIVMSRKSSDQGATTPYSGSKSRQGSFAGSSRGSSTPAMRRLSSLPAPASSASSHIPRKATGSRLSVIDMRATASPSPGPRSAAMTPTPGHRISNERTDNRPRWNGSTNLKDTALGHNFKPLSLTTPSPYRKNIPTPSTHPPRALRSVSSHSAIPVPSPLGRASAMSPPPHPVHARPASTTPAQQAAKVALNNAASRRVSAVPNPSTPLRRPASAMRARTSASYMPSDVSVASSSRRSSTVVGPDTVEEEQDDTNTSPTIRMKPVRPASALAIGAGRRSSLLPQPKSRVASATGPGVTGRHSRQGSQSKIDTANDKPKWRF